MKIHKNWLISKYLLFYNFYNLHFYNFLQSNNEFNVITLRDYQSDPYFSFLIKCRLSNKINRQSFHVHFLKIINSISENENKRTKIFTFETIKILLNQLNRDHTSYDFS